LSNAYYDGRTDYDTIETILGCEEAMRLKLLSAAIDQTSAIPEFKHDLPTDNTFYNGEVAKWMASSWSESSDGI